MKNVGDPCPYCSKPLSKALIDYKRRSKANNARASIAKAKANGSKMGREKVRDDAKILKLRRKGFSIRAIAWATGVSTTAVQRSLKENK